MHRLYLALASSLALGACEPVVGVVTPGGPRAETCEAFDPPSLPSLVDSQADTFQDLGWQGEMWVTTTTLTREACLACEGGECLSQGAAGDGELYFGDWSDERAGEWCDITGQVVCGPVWDDGRCSFVAETEWSCAVEGRPLLVDGHAITADVVQRAWVPADPDLARVPAHLREAVRDRWIQAGLMEHSSILAFERFSQQLVALGAPAALIADAATAVIDEARHARACFAIASALGPSVAPGPLDLPHLGRVDAESVLRSTFLEGCVGETVAAALARAGAEAADDPHIHDVLSRIADDETRHAALAWRTVHWILHQHPSLGRTLATLGAQVALVPSADSDLGHHGWPGGHEADAIGRDTLEQVVRPLVEDVLGQTRPRRALQRQPASA